MPAGQNSDVESIGAQTFQRGRSLPPPERVVFAADDVKRNGVSRRAKYAVQVPPFRIALLTDVSLYRFSIVMSPILLFYAAAG